MGKCTYKVLLECLLQCFGHSFIIMFPDWHIVGRCLDEISKTQPWCTCTLKPGTAEGLYLSHLLIANLLFFLVGEVMSCERSDPPVSPSLTATSRMDFADQICAVSHTLENIYTTWMFASFVHIVDVYREDSLEHWEKALVCVKSEMMILYAPKCTHIFFSFCNLCTKVVIDWITGYYNIKIYHEPEVKVLLCVLYMYCVSSSLNNYCHSDFAVVFGRINIKMLVDQALFRNLDLSIR